MQRIYMVAVPLLLLAACAGGTADDKAHAVPSASEPRVSTTTSISSTTTSTAASTTSAPTAAAFATAPVSLALRRVTDDPATDGFEAFVERVLLDPRGWTQAGFTFTFDPAAEYSVELLEPDDAQEACRPYDIARTFSCQIGPRVVLNADRWRQATDSWPASLDDYRTMLVNHEVGHLLGQHHPLAMCGTRGGRAAVMGQQSKGLDNCEPNPWPLPWEIACAARHEEPLAPGYEPSAEPTCTEADT